VIQGKCGERTDNEHVVPSFTYRGWDKVTQHYVEFSRGGLEPIPTLTQKGTDALSTRIQEQPYAWKRRESIPEFEKLRSDTGVETYSREGDEEQIREDLDPTNHSGCSWLSRGQVSVEEREFLITGVIKKKLSKKWF